MVNRIKQFEDYQNQDPAICTDRELQVLKLYAEKKVKAIAQDLNITISNVHSVFHRIRQRRDRLQKRFKIWNKLCKDPRFYQVLQPKALLEDEDT